MNESTVKNHISLKTGFGHNATRRTSFLSWFQACQRVLPPVLIIQLQGHLQDRRGICSTSSSSSSSSPTTTSSDNETREREDRTESDTSPVPVSSFNVNNRTGRNPLSAVNPITSQFSKPIKNSQKQIKRRP